MISAGLRKKQRKKWPGRFSSLWVMRCDSCEGHSLLLLTRAVIIRWCFLMTQLLKRSSLSSLSSLFPNREEAITKTSAAKEIVKSIVWNIFLLKALLKERPRGTGHALLLCRSPDREYITECFFSLWSSNGKEKNKQTNKHPPKTGLRLREQSLQGKCKKIIVSLNLTLTIELAKKK